MSSYAVLQGLLAFPFVPLLVADVSDISHFLSVFHKPHEGLIQAARQLLSGELAPLRQKLLVDLLHTVSENIAAETRAEDPPWFEGTLWVRGLGGSWEWEGFLRPDSPGGPGFCSSSRSEGLPSKGLAWLLCSWLARVRAALGLAIYFCLFFNCGKVYITQNLLF